MSCFQRVTVRVKIAPGLRPQLTSEFSTFTQLIRKSVGETQQ